LLLGLAAPRQKLYFPSAPAIGDLRRLGCRKQHERSHTVIQITKFERGRIVKFIARYFEFTHYVSDSPNRRQAGPTHWPAMHQVAQWNHAPALTPHVEQAMADRIDPFD
jgi:hypothetical protein